MNEAQFLAAIKKAAPNAKKEIADGVAASLAKNAAAYGLTTDRRISIFLAQAAHETGGFETLTEYASGEAYEGRKDLGNTVAGDGKRFKGRGIFQITGRKNYDAMSKEIWGNDVLIRKPEILATPDAATVTALLYWKSRNLNEIADKPDTWRSNAVKIAGNTSQLSPFQYITYRINGGKNGEADREKYWALLKNFVNSPGGNIAVFVGLLFVAWYFIKLKS